MNACSESEVCVDSMAVFCEPPVPASVWIHPGDLFPLRADLAAGRSERSAVEPSGASQPAAFKETAKHSTFFSFLCDFPHNAVFVQHLSLIRRNRYIRRGRPYGSRLSLNSWESLPRQKEETRSIVSCAKNCKDMVITARLW